MGLETTLWRAIAVFRVAALGYAAILIANNFRGWSRPVLGWAVLALMVAWTGTVGWAYLTPRLRRWPLLGADLLVTGACLLASRWVIPPADLAHGAPTLPMAWVAGPVLAWAVAGGRRAGLISGLLLGAVDLSLRGRIADVTVNGTVLLLLSGVILGYLTRIGLDAERRLQRAAEREASARERDRLARGIHDSVLQVLALVQRRGAELGGEAADLGRLAGEQEATLRALVRSDFPETPGRGAVDLRAKLSGYASGTVQLATPAGPVPLPENVAAEVAAAVGSALDNVRVHCGPEQPAWVLVEDEGAAVTVTVRDGGPGIPAGRLAAAEADGRLGVAQSIRGRIRDLGGTVEIVTGPGQGTEVELRIPRPEPAGEQWAT
ncbi:MacS family sensor histidine kinase [Rhizomonospora bruguierae]|uniref:MacS family sensor histidine kinase n=1 Tax=Rhizomonospora bruguierae TaxID=1581705 RepID=UPI001BCD4138|nr:DUF5931 domain-containing protein [Micromonospora sp. NBRC 107566]